MPEMQIIEGASNTDNCIGGSKMYAGQCLKGSLDERILTEEGHIPINLLQFTEQLLIGCELEDNLFKIELRLHLLKSSWVWNIEVYQHTINGNVLVKM